MKPDIIDELRPEPVDVDTSWGEWTRVAIMSDRATAHASVHRRPTRLLAAAAAAALIVGGGVAAQRWLPREDVITPAAPRATAAPGSDGAVLAETATAMSRMDEIEPTRSSDRTSDGIGDQDLPLGTAPADAYVYVKLGYECVGTAKYEFGLNGDFEGAGVRCDEGQDVAGLVYEFPRRAAAGSENVVSITVDRPLRYTVTVGYREKSIHDEGPSGTLPDGRTYGSAAGGGQPDLVRVVGDSGVEGYADDDELSGVPPSSPAEAVREQEARDQRYRNGERVDRQIPVLDTQGRQVDTFTIMLPVPKD